MAARNESIGTVECPHKACIERCEVFRFKERGDSEKSVANRRFAGKLYGRCPKHGRFGGDANDTDTQEYILCNATMHGAAGDRQSAPATTPASLPNTKQTTPGLSSPATKPSPPHSAKRSSERSSPASSSPAKPSASSAPAPATTSESPAKKPSGFGFFGWEDQ